MDNDLLVLIEKYRPAIMQHRSRHALHDDSALLESGEFFLILDAEQRANLQHDADSFLRYLQEDWEDLFAGVYLPGGDTGQFPQFEELRVMRDLAADTLPRTSDGIPAGTPAEIAEQLLALYARGVQIVRPLNASADALVVMEEVSAALDAEVALVTDNASEGSGLNLIYNDSLARTAEDAVSREDATALVDAISKLPNPEQKGALFFDCPLETGEGVPTLLIEQALVMVLSGIVGIDPGSFQIDRDTQRRESLLSLMRARITEPALDPGSPQEILHTDPRLLAVRRGPLLCLHNLSRDSVEFRDRRDRYLWPEEGVVQEIISDDLLFPTPEGALFSLELQPREVMWLRFT